MSELQEMSIGGQTIWVEVDEFIRAAPVLTGDAIVPTSAQSPAESLKAPLLRMATTDLGPLLSSLFAPIVEGVRGSGLEEVNVEVTIGIKAEIGFFVAKNEGSGSLKVSAKWKPKTPPARWKARLK